MVRQARERSGGVPISVKIRTDVDMKKTVQLVQTAEQVSSGNKQFLSKTTRSFLQ